MTSPGERHRSRKERFEAARDADAAFSRRLVRWRVVAFVAALALGVLREETTRPAGTVLTTAAVLALVAFALLVRAHRRARRRERWHGTLAALAAEGLARLGRHWTSLPLPPGSGAGPDHPYAADLDVLGPASLRHLLDTPATAPGRQTLDAWLLAPSPSTEVRRRQEAVAELSAQNDFREELTARARFAGLSDEADLARFRDWCASPPFLAEHRLLVAASWVLPGLTATLGALQAAGVVDGAWWALGPALMLGVTAAAGVEVVARLEAASAGQAELGLLADLLGALAGVEGTSTELAALRETLTGSGGPEDSAAGAPAAAALRRLGKTVSWAEVRHNDLVHAALQLLLLWDVHVLGRLERWKERYGARVEEWLAALGRGEALCALATLQADHPDWCVPIVRQDGPPLFQAEALGHPLLPPDRCVTNDVAIGPPGSFLLVTGSNMSGKSTLLRAVGLAVVLARAGGPVAAHRCSMPALRVLTVMRIRDSLAQGLSQYMAELRRVARVVAAARGAGDGLEGGGDGRVLYLLDEPLQGTNEADRRVALRTVLRHLLGTPALGAVATHDLRLHAVDDLAAASRPVHFEGTVRQGREGPELAFDYRLRPGPSTSTNALELLRAVGLGGGEQRPGRSG